MRFVAPFLIGLVAAQSPITQVFGLLTPEVQQLDTLIKAYTSGTGDDVVAQSNKIVGLVQQQVGIVKGAAQLDTLAAAQLPGPVQDFTKLLKTTIDDLVSRKQIAVSNGIGGKVYNNLEKQLEGAKALAGAIKDKVPPELASVAQQLSGEILTVLQGGITAFQDQAGAGSGAGAGAGSAGASPAGGAGASLGVGSSSTTVSNGAGMSGMSGGMSGAGAGASAGGASAGASMGGASAGASMGSSGASSGGLTAGGASSPAVYTGAAASFKPTAVFGLVLGAVAVAAF